MNMAIEIRALRDTPKEEIYQAFTEAFQNYVIPLVFNQETTLARWELAGVNHDLSIGAFANSRLVAFVLHTKNGETLYNFGTGVIPEYRGQHLVESIYKHIDVIPGYDKYILEVIKENTKAHHLYKKLGFVETRNLRSYQGQLNIVAEEDLKVSYAILPLQYNEEMSKLRLFHPSIENSHSTTLKNSEYYEVHELRKNSELLAYAIYCPSQLGLKEIGARDSLEENLDQLFLKMKLNLEKLRIMNIDECATHFIEYLTERGLQELVTQYEMVKIPNCPT